MQAAGLRCGMGRGASSPPEFAGGSQSPTAVVVAGRTPRRAVTELRGIMIGIIGKKAGHDPDLQRAGAADPVHRGGGHAEPGDEGDGRRRRRASPRCELGYGAQRVRREIKKGERTPRGHRATKAEVGHAKKAGLTRRRQCSAASASTTRRARIPRSPTYDGGRVVTVDIFAPGEMREGRPARARAVASRAS